MNIKTVTQRVNAEIAELKASLEGATNTFQIKSLNKQIEEKTGALFQLAVVDKNIKTLKKSLRDRVESKGDNMVDKQKLDNLRKVRKFLTGIATAELQNL
ncbi:hypothetical protein K0U07_03965 [bacterium]|nr:hypothetical protein [bacterium]